MTSTIAWADLVPHLTGFAHIATVRPDGRPHVAKVAPVVDGEVLWIASRVSSLKARNMAAHPQVAVMFEPRAEAYVQADAELVTDLATKERIWSSGMFPFPLEGFFGAFDDPDFVLIRLTPTSAILMSQAEGGIRRDTWMRPSPD
jgi:general stress protein 26